MLLLVCEVTYVDKSSKRFTAVQCAELFLENMNPNVFNVETVETSVR